MNQPDENYCYFGKELFSIFEPKQATDEFQYLEDNPSNVWFAVSDNGSCATRFTNFSKYRRLRSACDIRQHQACDEFANKAKERGDEKCIATTELAGTCARTQSATTSSIPAIPSPAAGETKAASICKYGEQELVSPLPATNAPAAEGELRKEFKYHWDNRPNQNLEHTLPIWGIAYSVFKAAAIPRDASIRELEDTINDLRQKLAQKAVLMGAQFDAERTRLEREVDSWRQNAADATKSVLECRDLLNPGGNLSLKDAAVKLESDCAAVLEFIKWGDKQIDQLLAHCGKDECEDCALAVCPFKDELHFHHDGCPSCANVPDNHPLAKFTKEIATDSGARLSEKMQRYERAINDSLVTLRSCKADGVYGNANIPWAINLLNEALNPEK